MFLKLHAATISSKSVMHTSFFLVGLILLEFGTVSPENVQKLKRFSRVTLCIFLLQVELIL